MLQYKDKVLVAVSGGSDSIGLVLLLLALKEKYKIKISIAHLNHMLRKEESLRDQIFVENFAKNNSLTFYCKQIDVKTHAQKHKLSIEQAGRKLRYDYFQHLTAQHGFTKIAMGHNKNDNAELVLMNLLRGSGPKGLSGIPPIRDGIYIRPLIRTSKEQILDFLNSYNQKFMFDSSNNDISYLRNKIRCKLLVHLESEFNPEIIEALDRLSNILKSEEDYFEIETQKAFDSCLFKKENSSVSLFKKKISNLHPALLNRVLRKTIKLTKNDLNKITLSHINDIINFCFNTSSGNSIDLPGQIRVYKKNEIIIVKKEKRPLRDIGKKAKAEYRAAQNKSIQQ
jgi:tRNA(Ile)-lysidine synthase